MTTSSCDLLVIGLGPVGAVLAGLAARRGLSVTVVEREADLFPLPRAVQCDHEVLRILQEFGCADELLEGSILNDGLDLVTADREPFLSFSVPAMTKSGWPTSIFFHQPTLERLLRRTVLELGVDVRLSTSMTTIDQDARKVTATLSDGSTVEAAYAVGCDGARSMTRSAIGADLEDLGFEESWLVVDLLGVDPGGGLPTRCLQVCDPVRPHTVVPMPAPRFRFEFMLLEGETAPAMQERSRIEELLAPWVDPTTIEVERAAVYTFRGAVADRWRSGRILLCGDAAHQTPPFLGQGMCTGLRDVANLAWKLDAVHRRGAPETLLDTYQAERAPQARAVIAAAVEFGRLICDTDPESAAARDASFSGQPTDGGVAPELIPPLTTGRGIEATGGDLSHQPTLGDERLDDLVGPRFLLVTDQPIETDGDLTQFWKAEGVVLETGVFPALTPLLGGEHACVVRPDRYLFARGEAVELTTKVSELLGCRGGQERNRVPLTGAGPRLALSQYRAGDREVAMLAGTEEQTAIVAHLVKKPGVTTGVSRTGPTGWVSSTVVGGGPGVDPSTIVFERTRVLPTCHMHSVGFTNHRGMPEVSVIRTWQAPDGSWVIAPLGGGGRGPSRRPKPWVNFTAGFGPDGFAAGGYVEGTGSEEARSVRLTFADGLLMEDAAENGIVLFFEPRAVTFPADVEILDARGGRLALYKAFDEFPFGA
ncbi:MAG TPA: bifunctional 3-(3-hydroxy-phenyl)propionate/3-hydroxycinnamic acid hydroxylase [Acidimicrobiales bacterium]|nr:bifunctional 3-(3-hydroxy-phenyl)propionate/3-hydroxycinnamic acid hydroxylase [Acidimicrobiales bacterium]